MAAQQNTIRPINAAEARALSGTVFEAVVEVKSWVEFRLTASWADQADSTNVLKATDVEAAKLEAGIVRDVLSKLPTFAGLRLSRVQVVERTLRVVQQDLSEDGDGERVEYVRTRLQG